MAGLAGLDSALAPFQGAEALLDRHQAALQAAGVFTELIERVLEIMKVTLEGREYVRSFARGLITVSKMGVEVEVSVMYQ